MTVPPKAIELVERFERHLDLYKRAGYKKARVRVEFNVDESADVARHDQMLDLHKKLATATIPADKKLYQRQIEATDRQIDALVYELYELTQEEIQIVEDASN